MRNPKGMMAQRRPAVLVRCVPGSGGLRRSHEEMQTLSTPKSVSHGAPERVSVLP